MALEKEQKAGARAVLAGNAVQSPQKEAPAVEEPAKFDPAIVLGTTSEHLAYTYALAVTKMLAVGPCQPATRVRAVRFLTLALEFLK